MIVYSVAAGSVSIAAMFMAGVLPGVVTGLFIMLVAGIMSIRAGYSGEVIEMPKWKPIAATVVLAGILLSVFLASRGIGFEFNFELYGRKIHLGPAVTYFALWSIVCCALFKSFRRAYLTLLLIVIVIGGILGGIFTATEAAAIAVVYAFLLSVLVYREIKVSELPSILLEAGITTAVVMLLIGASSGMSWIMTMANIPQSVSATLLGMSENPLVILLMINILLILVGTFMAVSYTHLTLPTIYSV